jgi:hypothetical protein
MAYTTINKPNTQFNTVLWTGNGGTQSITGVGFQPSLVWGKSRSVNYEQSWIDFVRGGTKYLFSNGSSAESTDANAITSFNADGITLGSSPYIGNANGATYVGWNWLASNSTVSNTSGSITSTVSANTTARFSILTYTGNGTGNSTVGHGLGAVPNFIIVKSRTSADAWGTLSPSYVSAADPNILYLNNIAAEADDTNVWGTSANFTSSTFTVGTWNGSNANATDYVAYCWSEIKGYSKFGKYTGNGSNDGTFVYTGFKPAFIMLRKTAGNRWRLLDNKRPGYNTVTNALFAELNAVETTASDDAIDLLSNGFKLRGTSGNQNDSGGTYIYMAFAENPFVSSTQIPTTAR